MATNVEIKRYAYHVWSSRDGIDKDHSIATITLFDDPAFVRIRTGLEPVGEGEGPAGP